MSKKEIKNFKNKLKDMKKNEISIDLFGHKGKVLSIMTLKDNDKKYYVTLHILNTGDCYELKKYSKPKKIIEFINSKVKG